MAPDGADVVRTVVQGFNEQDLDLFLSVLDPEVELHTLKLGKIVGHEQAARWATKHPGGLQQHIVIEELIPSGDQIVALLRQQWLWEGTDEVAEDNEVAALFKIRDGKVVRWKPYRVRSEALKEAGIES
jgi:hypothetical protein